jgi:hypothetical protein
MAVFFPTFPAWRPQWPTVKKIVGQVLTDSKPDHRANGGMPGVRVPAVA